MPRTHAQCTLSGGARTQIDEKKDPPSQRERKESKQGESDAKRPFASGRARRVSLARRVRQWRVGLASASAHLNRQARREPFSYSEYVSYICWLAFSRFVRRRRRLLPQSPRAMHRPFNSSLASPLAASLPMRSRIKPAGTSHWAVLFFGRLRCSCCDQHQQPSVR